MTEEVLHVSQYVLAGIIFVLFFALLRTAHDLLKAIHHYVTLRSSLLGFELPIVKKRFAEWERSQKAEMWPTAPTPMRKG